MSIIGIYATIISGGANNLKNAVTIRGLTTDRSSLLKISLLCMSLTFSFILAAFGPDLWGGILALTFLLCTALTLSEMDLLHPYTWFTPLFYLYAVSQPSLVVAGDLPYLNGLNETLFVEWVALASFLVVFGIPRKRAFVIDEKPLRNMKSVLWPLYTISLVLTFSYLAYVFIMGIGSKYALAQNSSIFKKTVPFFSIYILAFILLLAYYLLVNKRIPKALILLTAAYTFLALLIIGERDLILRVAVASVFLVHILHKRISRKTLLVAGLLILLTIPIMGGLRNSAVSYTEAVSHSGSVLSQVMGSEFSSASRNLRIIIDNQHMWAPFHGQTFWWDVKLAFLGYPMSATVWFNETFFPGLMAVGGGNGFTIVGEGYVNFGVFGVIVLFAFLALFLKFLYTKASQHIIWLVVYITSIPIVIYLNRTDLATLFAQLSKHILIPILLIYIVKKMNDKISNAKN